METEFEVKFYPVDKKALIKKLKKLGAKLVVPQRKLRRAVADDLANPRLKCNYIRVRDEGDVIRLSAKMHAEEEGKIEDQKETDVEVTDYDKTIQILKEAGLKFNRYQETLRETWEYNGVTVDIDEWPELKPRVEIESDSTEKVREVALKLGFDWDKRIITAMPEIYAKVYGLEVRQAVEMCSNLTFEDNPFKGLVKKYPGKNYRNFARKDE